jgi:zinc transport system substrate-binding protein
MRACIALLCAVAVGSGCARQEGGAGVSAASDAPLRVFTVNEPLKSFAERIGGDAVEVVFPAPEGQDPAFWSPDPGTVAAYQRADLVLLNGVGYAKWVERVSLPRARLVDTSAEFRERAIPLEDELTHLHGPGGAHSHQGFASTTWLDPELAILQARQVARAFVAARPEQEAAFRAGLEALEAELRALDARLAAAARALNGAPLLFSHPVYQYLVRRYALDARSLHWEPDAAPAPDQWRELDALLAAQPARALIWEAEPLPETRRALEARGLPSVVFAPAASTRAEGDFLDEMRRNAAAFESLSAGS